MQTLYAKSDIIKSENERIITDIKSVMSFCTTLDIYCGVEFDVFGIWIKIDEAKYLVDPIKLVNSIFEEGTLYMLRLYQLTDGIYKKVDVYKEKYCYTWRFEGGISPDPRPIYFNFEEYVSKIKECIDWLYLAIQSDQRTAYEKSDSDEDDIRIAYLQMNNPSVMPSYYKLTSSSIKEEPFIFHIEEDEYREEYTIGIGNKQYTTYLTHWDNEYETIRYQFEGLAYKGQATIALTFDMSDLVLKISRVSIIDEVNESNEACGFKYKDYALVEIQPNDFVHGPIIKGYCDLKQTLKTFYEGLLMLALAHSQEEQDYDEPCQIEAYNMFKSPVIERYITGDVEYNKKAKLRQVHVKRILTICPDYDEIIFDNDGNNITLDDNGNIEGIYDKDVKPFNIPGLKEWQMGIKHVVEEGAVGRNVPNFNWEDFHERGLKLAQKFRHKLSSDFDLWYQSPVEDNSGIIPKPILIYEQKEDKEDKE